MPLERALNISNGFPLWPKIFHRNINVDGIKHKIENFQINLFNDLNLAVDVKESVEGAKTTNWWALRVLFSIQFAFERQKKKKSLSPKSQSWRFRFASFEKLLSKRRKDGTRGEFRLRGCWFESCTSCKLSFMPKSILLVGNFLHCKSYWMVRNSLLINSHDVFGNQLRRIFSVRALINLQPARKFPTVSLMLSGFKASSSTWNTRNFMWRWSAFKRMKANTFPGKGERFSCSGNGPRNLWVFNKHKK